MDAPVVSVNDTGTAVADDEIHVEIQENTPSVGQEVNKQSDAAAETEETIECSKTWDTETDMTLPDAKVDMQRGSPKKVVKRNVWFPDESPVDGYLDPPDPWRDGNFFNMSTGLIRGCQSYSNSLT